MSDDFYVTKVAKNSNAEKIGLKEGDQIISIDDETINKENLESLKKKLETGNFMNIQYSHPIVTYLFAIRQYNMA